MLRRFNSLIKGPKALGDEDGAENVSLRPARSVDSSLFAAQRRGGGAPVSPLNPLLVRRSDDGQTSLNVAVPHGPSSRVMGRVPEERSWKEGYEQVNLDSPGTPQQQYEPEEKPSDHGEAPHDSASATVTPSGDEGAQAPRQIELPPISRVSSDAVVVVRDAVVDIPDAQADSGIDLEDVRKSVATAGPGRTISSWSSDSAAEHCRICQQLTEEPLIELGCMCRGEMSKSHKSCIEMWFKNKGSNKCEVCQHVASNIPAPETSPVPHFWIWRLGGQNGLAQGPSSQTGAARRVGFQSGLLVNRPVLLMIIKKHPILPVMWISLLAFMTYLFVEAINTSSIGYAAMPIGFLLARFHALWAALGILMAGLLFDVLISIFLGASALPVNIIIGVLVVLGLGTAVRLVMECCHQRDVERNIRRMELLSIDPEPVQAPADNPTEQNRQELPV